MERTPKASWPQRWRLIGEIASSVPSSLRWGLVVTYIFSTISGALLPLSLKLLVDGALAGSASRIAVAVIFAAVMAAGADGATRASGGLRSYFMFAGGHRVSVRLMRVVATLPTLEHLERPEHADQLQLISGKGNTVASSLTDALDGVRTVIQIVSSVALLISVDARLAIFPLFVLPSLILTGRIHRIQEAARENATELERGAAHLNSLFTDPDAAMEMRVFGAQASLDDEADRQWHTAVETRLAGELRAALLSTVGIAFLAAGYIGALAVVGIGARGDLTAAGSMMMVIQIAGRLRWNLQSSIGLGQQLRTAAETLDRIVWIESYQPTGCVDPTPNATPPERLRVGLRLDHVSFRYPGTDKDVLSDVTLDLPAGTVVALVGDNGAGKTTLIKLLCGFYPPTSGRILVDDVDVGTLPAGDWQHRTTAAFQDFLQLQDAFRRSIAPVIPGPIPTDAQIETAAERADALAMTSEWADGLDQHLGKYYFDGVELSRGQWQRVAVARAMFKERPLLLILDEPTASLDPAAEHRLYERYSAAAREARADGGTVTVLISHRFSTVRMADHIAVLDNGTIIEHGTHAELMIADGRYAELFKRQADAYA